MAQGVVLTKDNANNIKFKQVYIDSYNPYESISHAVKGKAERIYIYGLDRFGINCFCNAGAKLQGLSPMLPLIVNDEIYGEIYGDLVFIKVTVSGTVMNLTRSDLGIIQDYIDKLYKTYFKINVKEIND